MGALISLGYVLSFFYFDKVSNAQTCTQIGGNLSCAKIRNISGTFTPQCTVGQYAAGLGYTGGDGIDNDDVWIWCCDYFQ